MRLQRLRRLRRLQRLRRAAAWTAAAASGRRRRLPGRGDRRATRTRRRATVRVSIRVAVRVFVRASEPDSPSESESPPVLPTMLPSKSPPTPPPLPPLSRLPRFAAAPRGGTAHLGAGEEGADGAGGDGAHGDEHQRQRPAEVRDPVDEACATQQTGRGRGGASGVVTAPSGAAVVCVARAEAAGTTTCAAFRDVLAGGVLVLEQGACALRQTRMAGGGRHG